MSKRFAALMQGKPLTADGAMGTMLQKYGLAVGACPEMMNLDAPEVVARVHSEYIAAGAQLIETNTFGGNPIRLGRYGLAQQAALINRQAVEIARKAAGDAACVLASIGPLGELVEPYGDITELAAAEAFAVQAEAFAAAEADACIVETMADLNEALLAVKAAVAAELPVIAQLSYEASGRTFMGVDPQAAATALAEAGASVIGANCSVGPADMLEVVKQLRAGTGLPISAMPNAGLPQTVNGVTEWPLLPAEFAAWGVRLAEAGAAIIGGCCGTSPAHISALADSLRSYRSRIAERPVNPA